MTKTRLLTWSKRELNTVKICKIWNKILIVIKINKIQPKSITRVSPKGGASNYLYIIEVLVAKNLRLFTWNVPLHSPLEMSLDRRPIYNRTVERPQKSVPKKMVSYMGPCVHGTNQWSTLLARVINDQSNIIIFFGTIRNSQLCSKAMFWQYFEKQKSVWHLR